MSGSLLGVVSFAYSGHVSQGLRSVMKVQATTLRSWLGVGTVGFPGDWCVISSRSVPSMTRGQQYGHHTTSSSHAVSAHLALPIRAVILVLCQVYQASRPAVSKVAFDASEEVVRILCTSELVQCVRAGW